MSRLNVFATAFLDALLDPIDAWSPALSVSLVAAATAAVMLLVMKWLTNQREIAAVKRRIRSRIFEIRLFGDDARALGRALGDIAVQNVRYLRLSLLPLVVAALPLAALLGHLHARYGYEGLRPGAPALIRATVLATQRPDFELVAPPGIRVEVPGMWIPALREIAWRIVPETTGDYEVRLVVDARAAAKRLHVSSGTDARSPVRATDRWIDQLRYPAEPPLPDDSPIRAIVVPHPSRTLSVGWWQAHWAIVFAVAMVVATLALRRRFGVEI